MTVTEGVAGAIDAPSGADPEAVVAEIAGHLNWQNARLVRVTAACSPTMAG